ncbi:MAG: aminoacyl-tRNA deacylase [Candidatus Kariarchaeaceae archaeon]|jgi:prolyl-tRNA editing enzyme YbaK/EbsC (Cys-tRNA(Pro) deacylase)
MVEDQNVKAEHLIFEESIHTVADCIRVSGYPIEEITKSIVMIGKEDKTIVALVPAKFRASTKRVGKILNQPPPTIATTEQTLERTGYPAGGVPFIGFTAIRLVDPKIIEREYIYTGGGSNRSLLKLWVSEIKKLNPIIKRVRN